MKIGSFTKTENGFIGTITTLAVNTPATIEEQENYFMVKANDQRIGAAWS